MASALMNVNLKVKIGGELIFLFIVIVTLVGWLSVKIAANWMKSSSIAQHVKWINNNEYNTLKILYLAIICKLLV